MPSLSSAVCAQVARYIKQEKLFDEGARLLAAVSGGEDSMAMLYILASLREELGFYLAAAHFDHQLRSQSCSEGQLVEAYCRQNGIDCYLGGADVRALAIGKNLEDTARLLRYQFLYRTAKQIGAEKIATAHHAEDQAETFFLHLLRGSGSEGLAAIAPKENLLIRPLLGLKKQQLQDICREQALPTAFDASNLDTAFLRNRLRLELLPQLKTYNPRTVEVVCAASDVLRAENELLKKIALQAREDVAVRQFSLNALALDGLPLALRRRVVRLTFEEFALQHALEVSLSFEHTADILALGEGRRISLPCGVIAYRQNGEMGLCFSDEPQEAVFDQQIALELTDRWLPLADWGWEYLAQQVNSVFPLVTDDFFVAPAELLPRLAFRTRRAGDLFTPRGFNGRKKLKEFFIDRKIPREKRAGWPLLTLDDQVVWVVNLREGELPAAGDNKIYIKCRPIS